MDAGNDRSGFHCIMKKKRSLNINNVLFTPFSEIETSVLLYHSKENGKKT